MGDAPDNKGLDALGDGLREMFSLEESMKGLV